VSLLDINGNAVETHDIEDAASKIYLNTTTPRLVTLCSKFCQTLPDHSLQIGIETSGSDECGYATQSPPKFSLKDKATDKFALGLLPTADCTYNL